MIKISKLIKESEEFKINESEKRTIMDSIRKYNQYGNHIYSNKSFHKAVSELKNICELGSNLILQETEDWFDSITVKRDIKSINDSYKLFEKTSNEIVALQRRLESLYEDIGDKLNKYYEIDDIDKDSDRDELTENKVFDSFEKDFKNAIVYAGAFLQGNIITIYLDDNPNSEKNLINKLIRTKYSSSLKKINSAEDVMKFKIV